MEWYIYLRNIQDLLSDGKTPYERRFGEPVEGPIVPFHSMVEYHPQFCKKVLPGRFFDCVVIFTRRDPEEDMLIHAETVDAKEVSTHQNVQFVFPRGE